MDVTSFGINHDKLLRGIYVSRKDTVENGTLTTFDVRMKEPNREMVMDTSVMHTIEHLMATFFRGHQEWSDKTIYVGPMGEIPAAKSYMCGNYLDHNLDITKIECCKFLEEVLYQIKKENLEYPVQGY